MQQIIVDMYTDGLSAPKIADRLGISSTTVYKHLDDAGVDRRSQKKAQNRVEIPNLREMYHERGMTSYEIAEKVGCNKQTVINRMKEQGIPRRNRGTQKDYSAGHRWRPDGYEMVRDSYSMGEDSVLIHRLCAVAWFGYDSVIDMDVHHKNGCKWDNRECNMELLTRSEHTSYHMTQRHS